MQLQVQPLQNGLTARRRFNPPLKPSGGASEPASGKEPAASILFRFLLNEDRRQKAVWIGAFAATAKEGGAGLRQERSAADLGIQMSVGLLELKLMDDPSSCHLMGPKAAPD